MGFIRRRSVRARVVTVCESCARACDQACRAGAGLDRLRTSLPVYPFTR
jgi:hypothetical protein